MEIDGARCLERMDTDEYETIGEISFNSLPDPLLSTRNDLYRGFLTKSPDQVVVKKIEVHGSQNYQEIVREFKSAEIVGEDLNVLKLKRYESKGSLWYIAYQNFDYSLDNLIMGKVNHPNIPDMSITKILYSITKGLKKLHENNIVHRNIRPEYIVIHNGEGKIANLSLSKLVFDEGKLKITQDFFNNIYSAPELQRIYKHNRANQKKGTQNNLEKNIADGFKLDVFSMGIVYFYALTGFHLFERDGTETENNIRSRNFELNFKSLNDSIKLEPWKIPLAKQLIEAMVQFDPKKRPTVKQILNHPFFWNYDQTEKFLKIASQYILGSDDCDKATISTNSVIGAETWNKELEQVIKDHIDQYESKFKNKKKKKIKDEIYVDPAKEFLRQLRNIPEHANEKKNEPLRESFDHLPGGILEYFLRKHPNCFSNYYDCFNEFSSYKPLRKFFCDCFFNDHFYLHTCSKDIEFCSYDWMNFIQTKKN